MAQTCIYVDLSKFYRLPMGLKDIGARLPPGFRFYPTDEELVCHYLSKKTIDSATAYKDETDALKTKGMTLVEIDLHTVEPWQLPGMYLSLRFLPLSDQ